MESYFHGNSEIQVGDGLQTLYLMNSNYIPYSDTHESPNRMLINPIIQSHAPPHNHHLVGIPLSATATSSIFDNNLPRPSVHGEVPADYAYQMGFRLPPLVSPTQQQSLSLSLSSQQHISAQTQHSAVFGSKYLKVAQEVLDKVVHVGKGIKIQPVVRTKEKRKMKMELTREGLNESVDTRGVKLTTSQRQELHMKKVKLVGMLDEVEGRYRQYHTQMQLVASTFEKAAGFGAAKSYTSLALETISKQFRCIKDTICAQIKATSKSLGEEECFGVKGERSRQIYVDNQLRQQTALLQLGTMQHNNAWRSQRGLPDRAVSVLRAWLFEHFLHPYPKDTDKQMLAKQTGLTRSQVSNWFINARVRLWKPMVEELNMEESNKDQEQCGPKHNQNKGETTNVSPADIQTQSDFSNGIARSAKKPKNIDMQNSPSSITDMKFGVQGQNKEAYNNALLTATINQGGGFGTYQIEDITRFSRNNVYLTLGLPHCENQQNHLPNHGIQLGRRLEFRADEPDLCGINAEQASHSSLAYANMNIQDRKLFSAHSMKDFVT